MSNNQFKEMESFISRDYECLANDAMNVTQSIQSEQNVLLIQPYVKWGPKKSKTTPDMKLLEAEDLIRSLETWTIRESVKVGLESFDNKYFFGRGKMEELRLLSKKYNYNLDERITCVFVSKSVLTRAQKKNLEQIFKLPVLDRFSVVIQILRLHATSREAKLQVAQAEIPYIWRQLGSPDQKQHGRLSDWQRLILRNREKKIKTELEKVKNHRQIIRKKRLQQSFPIIAVVGYTNAGKTSLIKSLTNEVNMRPRNQLFATLDITAHGGVLPSNLQVIYMDTIGFMADIPTGLIECFVATLEDALIADVIIHVQDISHPNFIQQRLHVEETLRDLLQESDKKQQLLDNIVEVGNKCDLVKNLDEVKEAIVKASGEDVLEKMHFVSSKKMTGLQDMSINVEKNVLTLTNRKKMIIRVRNGGNELAWLYKNSAVTLTEADSKSSDHILVHVVITELGLIQFKNVFLKSK